MPIASGRRLRFQRFSFSRGLPLMASLLFFAPLSRAQSTFDLGYWKTLLQYEKSFLSAEQSEAHNAEFFVSPNGGKDPEAELKASLSAIAEKRLIQNQPFECVFPGR